VHVNIRNTCTVLRGKPEGRDHLPLLDIDNRIILKCILKIIGFEGVDCPTRVAEDGDIWRAVLNAVMNLRVPEKTETFLTS